MTRTPYTLVLEELDLLQRLDAYEPVVIGTPPLGIDVAGSDIDVACYATDLTVFAVALAREFGAMAGYLLYQRPFRTGPAMICRFTHSAWSVEIFGQSVPVADQHGVRHFHIERRLLDLLGPEFRAEITALKAGGMATEPAFAQLLGLRGDPYQALLMLEDRADDDVRQLWQLP